MIVEKQPFPGSPSPAKQRNGQRRQYTDQRGNQQATKHDLNIRIIVQTVHQRLR
jgi:hypothetical protein